MTGRPAKGRFNVRDGIGHPGTVRESGTPGVGCKEHMTTVEKLPGNDYGIIAGVPAVLACCIAAVVLEIDGQNWTAIAILGAGLCASLVYAVAELPTVGGRLGVIRGLLPIPYEPPVSSHMIGGVRVIFTGECGTREKARVLDGIEARDFWTRGNCETCQSSHRSHGEYYVCRRAAV